jgi:hypothetical protein
MKPIKIAQFSGINNRALPQYIPDTFLTGALNFLIDAQKKPYSRDGVVKKITGNVTSLCPTNAPRLFAVIDGDLCEVSKSYTATTILADIGASPLSMLYLDSKYYYTSQNTSGTGIIDGSSVKSFGLAKNQSCTVSTTAGTMRAGRYLVGVTFVDVDGFESGIGTIRMVTLAETVEGTGDKAITVSWTTPSNSRIVGAYVYCSTRNGKVLYRADISPITTGSTVIYNPNSFSIPLAQELIGMDAAPKGDLIAYFYDRMLIANGNELYFSEELDYEHWDYRNYISLAGAITAICPVEDGVWISADELYFAAGRDINNLIPTSKATFTVFKNSEKLIQPQNLSIEGYSGFGWAVTTTDGVYLLLNSGGFVSVTQQVYGFPNFTHCSGAIIDDTNNHTYISLLRGG